MEIARELKQKIEAVSSEEQMHIIVKSRHLDPDIMIEAFKKPRRSVRHEMKMINYFSMALPAGDIEGLAGEPWVEKVEEDSKVYAYLNETSPLIGTPSVWDSGFTGKEVSVAIIDSGLDKHHPDLLGRVVATKDFTLEGFTDGNGHGTHVTGIIAGDGEVSGGLYRGVAPDCLILSAKALRTDGTGRMSDVMAAVEWAVDLGARVINLSLGTPGPSDGGDALSRICDAAVSRGIVVCVAAGNAGPRKRSVGSPGAARLALTVGATTKKDAVADFSSRGPTADERFKPEIVAPGVDVISLRAKGVDIGRAVDEKYAAATGTSMSTPHVAGLVALLLEAKPDASPQLIREALLNTAKNLEAHEDAQGMGRIDAEEALRYARTHENPPEPPDELPPRSGCLNIAGNLIDAVSGWLNKRRR